MKFKYKLLLFLISISLVGCLYVSQSYAFWMITSEQKNVNQVTSGCFSINFVDTNGGQNGSINLTNTYPVTDTLGLTEKPYQFTITNSCTIKVSYNVILNTITNTSGSGSLDDAYIKYALHKKTNGDAGKPTSGTKLSSKTSSGSSSGVKASYILDTGTLTAGTRTSGSITPGQSVTYDLYLWIDEAATIENAAGKTFEAKLDVSANPSNS